MGQTTGRTPLVIVAILTPHSGSTEIFREYETKAARILARHGGVIERTVVEQTSGLEKPGREVHVITFPDLESFDSYGADPDLASLAGMRVLSIAHTELLFGRDGPDYMSLCKS